MAERRFDIIFDGSVLNGCDVSDVKNNVQTLFKLGDNDVNRLFTGEPIAIKKNLDRRTANQYQAALSKAGAKIQLILHRSEQDEQTIQQNEAAQPGDAASADGPSGLSLLPAGSPLLDHKEKIAAKQADIATDHLQLERENPFLTPDSVPVDAQDPFLASGTQQPSYPTNDHIEVDAVMTVAEAGSILAEQGPESPPVSVDIDYLDIDPVGIYLLDAGERDTDVISQLNPDFELSEVGTDLLPDGEKRVYERLEVDTSGLTLIDESS